MSGPYSGNSGVVMIGANAVAKVTGFSFTESVNERDETVLGDTVDQRQAGTKRVDGQLSCLLDDGDTDGQETLTAGASVTLLLQVAGTGSGKPQASIGAIVGEVGEDVPGPNETVRRSFSFWGNSIDRTAQV